MSFILNWNIPSNMPVFGPSSSKVIDAAGLGLEPQEKGGGDAGGVSQLHHLPELDAMGQRAAIFFPSLLFGLWRCKGRAERAYVCVCV